MLFVREMMCFNLNLALKMYPKMYIFLFLAAHFVI